MNKPIYQRALVALVTTILLSSVARANDDDFLLLVVPSIIGALPKCDSQDVTKCRNENSCIEAGGIYFNNSCRVKCNSSSVTQCLVESTCDAAGGLFVSGQCRALEGTLAQLVRMKGTWEFSSSHGSETFYFDVSDIEPDSIAEYKIIGDIKSSSSFKGYLFFDSSINSFELINVHIYTGTTFDRRQFQLTSATRGNGLHGLSVNSSWGEDMSLIRKSTIKNF